MEIDCQNMHQLRTLHKVENKREKGGNQRNKVCVHALSFVRYSM